MNLNQLRERLSAVDRDLISLIAQRQAIVAEIGKNKISTGKATRDYALKRMSRQILRTYSPINTTDTMQLMDKIGRP